MKLIFFNSSSFNFFICQILSSFFLLLFEIIYEIIYFFKFYHPSIFLDVGFGHYFLNKSKKIKKIFFNLLIYFL